MLVITFSLKILQKYYRQKNINNVIHTFLTTKKTNSKLKVQFFSIYLNTMKKSYAYEFYLKNGCFLEKDMVMLSKSYVDFCEIF